MTPKQDLRLALKTEQRMALLGRLRMAEWIEMPEAEFAREIQKLEKDALFQKLHFGAGAGGGIVRRERWPRGRISSGFYEVNERTASRGERVKVEEALEDRPSVLPQIRKMGREAFERYFLYAEEALSLGEIAARTGLAIAEVRAVNDMLLELGAQQEFFVAEKGPSARGYACLARLDVEGDEPAYEFFSPYWARGLYRIRYDLLEEWKKGGAFEGAELKRLPHLLKRLETINLRQNTLFRILESLAKLQAEFLKGRREDSKRPISLRMLAHRLDLAPSTVSRALSGRSVKLPWGKEVPLIELLPGRRRILRLILGRWLKEGSHETDAKLAEKLQSEYSIRVSRRTVNAVRNELTRPAEG